MNLKKLFSLLSLFILFFSYQINAQHTYLDASGNGGFENDTSFSGNGWTVANGTQINKWKLGSTPGGTNIGNRCAYISNNYSSFNYSGSVYADISYVYFYRDITFTSGETNVQLLFDVKGIGEDIYDNLKVYSVATSTTIAAGTPLYVAPVGLTAYSMQNDWVKVSINLTGVAGSSKRIVFCWLNDYGSVGSSSIAVDNIRLVSKTPGNMSGNFTINNTASPSSSNYTSFNEAVNDLNSNTVNGPITFNVSAGKTFAESVPPILATGTSSNTITFQRSGSGVNPIIKSSGFPGSAIDAGITLNGSDYLTFDGIDIGVVDPVNVVFDPTYNSGVEYGLLVRNSSSTNGATQNTFKNFKISLNRNYTSSLGILQTTNTTGGGVTPTAQSGTNSFNKYYNYSIENAGAGIYLLGSPMPRDSMCEFGTISNGKSYVGGIASNDIGNGNPQTWGIRAVGQYGIKIFNNTIRNITCNGSNSVDGILLDNNSSYLTYSIGTCEISNNRIYNLKNSSLTANVTLSGIKVFSTQNSGSLIKIYNNLIYNLTNYTSNVTGIRLQAINLQPSGSSTGSKIQTIYNTVRLSPPITNCHNTCFNIGTVSGFINEVKNNIFANYTTGQTGTAFHYCWVTSSTTSIGPSGSSSNYNDLYISDTANGRIGLANSAKKLTLANWQAITSAPDANSKSVDPFFNSSTDLHINEPLLNATATPMSSVTTVDADGETRNSSTPDIGADEFTPAPNDAGITLVPTPSMPFNSGTSNVIFTLRNFGSSTLTSVTINWSVSGSLQTPFSWTGSLVSGGVTNVIVGTFSFSGGILTTLKGWPTLPNGASDGNVTNDTSSSTLAAALLGNYDVGVGQTYSTLTEAVNLINTSGVSGPVTFTLKDATYSSNESFPITVNQFYGSSATNTLTIKPGNGVSPIISGIVSGGGLIKLNGADFITIDGSNVTNGYSRDLSIINSGNATFTTAIWVSSNGAGQGCRRNVIKNCVINCGNDMSSSGRQSYGIISCGSSIGITATKTGTDNDSNTYSNNYIFKVMFGIASIGNSAANPNEGTIIQDNLIGPAAFGTNQIGKAGILVYNEKTCRITGNDIRNVGILISQTASVADACGIILGTDSDWPISSSGYVANSIVSSNKISNIISEKSFSAIGILVATRVTSNTVTNNTIANNMIVNVRSNLTSSTKSSSGIALATSNGEKVCFNSVYLSDDIDPGLSSSAAFSSYNYYVLSNSDTNLTLKNNIGFMDANCNTGSVKHGCIYLPSSYSWGTGGANHNDWYFKSTNSQGKIGNIGGTSYTTLSSWITASSQDGNSVNGDPLFNSSTDLHASASVLNGAGNSVSGISADFDGEVRAATPDIGADEFNLFSYDINFIAIENPSIRFSSGNNQVKVRINNYGLSTISSITLGWSVNGVAQSDFTYTNTILSYTPGNGLPTYLINLGNYNFLPNTEANIKIWLKTINNPSVSDANHGNDTISLLTAPSMSGIVLVGLGNDFNTLTSAVNYLNTYGIVGPTTFTLTDATYTSETFPITINQMSGGSITNKLTIRPSTGVSSLISGVSSSSIIKLNGADFITIDGGSTRALSIYNTNNTSLTAAIWLASLGSNQGCKRDTIRNCNIKAGIDMTLVASMVYTFGIAEAGSTLYNVFGADNDSNAYINNYITKAVYGIASIGVSSSNPNNGTLIKQNIFGPSSFGSDQIGKSGVVIYNSVAPEICYNEVRFVGGNLSNTNTSGIDKVGIALSNDAVFPGTSAFVVRANVYKNQIHDIVDERTGSAIGILLAAADGTNTTGNKIHNNMLYNIRTNGDNTNSDRAVGIALSAGNKDTIAFNNILQTGDIDPSGTTSATASNYGIYLSSLSVSNTVIRNNVCHMSQTSNTSSLYNACLGIPASYTWGTGISNNNDYYSDTANPQSKVGSFGTTFYSSVSLWNTATSQDANSLNTNPIYTTTTNLHTNNCLLKAKAFPMSNMLTDFDESYRNIVNPDIGADEMTSLSVVGRWIGAVSTDWNNTGNWCDNTVPTCGGSTAIIPQIVLTYPIISVGNANANGVNINSGANLTLSGGNLNICGNLTLTGTLTQTTGTLVLNGANQTLAAGTYTNITCNGAGTKTFTSGSNLRIKNNLIFVSGVINTGNDTVILDSTALMNETNASFVSGNTKTSKYLNSSTSCIFSGIGVEITTSTIAPGRTLIYRKTGSSAIQSGNGNTGIARYYDIDPTNNVGLNSSLTLHYLDNELNSIPESNLAIFKSEDAGLTWDFQSNSGLNTSLNTISKTGVNDFSRWTIGSSINTLPVELISFTIKSPNPETVELLWSTVTEINNDYFEILRSVDARNWVSIGIERGNGTTNELHDYTYFDHNLPSTKTTLYYRLKQVDFNGSSTLSNILSVNTGEGSMANNIVTWYSKESSELNSIIYSETGKLIKVTLSGMEGKVLESQSHYLDKGSNKIKMKTGTYPAGTYLLHIEMDGKQTTQKLIIQ